MGIYGEYLERGLGANLEGLGKERKRQLARISQRRGGRDVLVYAADLKPVTTSERAVLRYMSSADILPITDQLANLSGKALDVILETPRGFAEIAEQILRLIRSRYGDLAVIVPGTARSAGTILAMGADDILMEPFASALGPIDAQLRGFSAEALLTAVDGIKKEAVKTGQLNKAYVPVLQGVSPGDLQHARNLLDFAKNLVTEWLSRYKFRTWTTHRTPGKRTSGKPVTPAEKKRRARQIANQLADHSAWKTHNRSLTLEDLRGMRLEITDYSADPELADPIRRYFTLLQMTFETNIYKLFETPTSQIARFELPPALERAAPPKPAVAGAAADEFECPHCHQRSKLQADSKPGVSLQPDHVPFPADHKLKRPSGGDEQELSQLRQQIGLEAK